MQDYNNFILLFKVAYWIIYFAIGVGVAYVMLWLPFKLLIKYFKRVFVKMREDGVIK